MNASLKGQVQDQSTGRIRKTKTKTSHMVDHKETQECPS
jgi:hypothetical protein